MHQTRDYHERAFRSLLRRVRPRELQRGVDNLLAKMDTRVVAGETVEAAFSAVYRRAAEQTIRQLVLARENPNCRDPEDCQTGSASAARRLQTLLEADLGNLPAADSPDFHCDAGLGGLARLLRAAGYDVSFWPDIDDDELLGKLPGTAAILLTNDRLLAARGVIQHGVIPAVLVPISLSKDEQLALVVQMLQLPFKSPRCMACGGELLPVDKHAVRDLIPPRTWPWRDEYRQCQRCGKLFWEGSHWERIQQSLDQVQ